MPTKHEAFFCLVVMLLFATIIEAMPPVDQDADTNPRVVTLLARKKEGSSDNYTRAAFSFRFGINGDDAVKVTRNDWDLLYGNLDFKGDRDWFTVTLVSDDRSRIKDLGELNWSDQIQIPVLPACPEEIDSCTCVIFPSASSGKSLTDVNGNVAKALVGHVYLVHTKDRTSDFYALFRVEELKSNESCTISWKRVSAPER